MAIPYKYDSQQGLDYYINMLKILRKKLEGITGNKITDEKLNEAITIYNQTREFLKKIGEMRKVAEPLISTPYFIRLNHASYYLDPIFINDVLASGLNRSKGDVTRCAKHNRPRYSNFLNYFEVNINVIFTSIF